MKNNETNYQYFTTLVALVLDGEASEKEQKMLEHYITTSVECKQKFESEQSFRRLIRESFSETHVPKSFVNQIRMNIV